MDQALHPHHHHHHLKRTPNQPCFFLICFLRIMSEPVGKTPSRNAVQFEPTKELRMLQTMPSGIYCHQEALLHSFAVFILPLDKITTRSQAILGFEKWNEDQASRFQRQLFPLFPCEGTFVLTQVYQTPKRNWPSRMKSSKPKLLKNRWIYIIWFGVYIIYHHYLVQSAQISARKHKAHGCIAIQTGDGVVGLAQNL